MDLIMIHMTWVCCCSVAQTHSTAVLGSVHGSSPHQQQYTVLLYEPPCIPVGVVYVPPRRATNDLWNHDLRHEIHVSAATTYRHLVFIFYHYPPTNILSGYGGLDPDPHHL